jgi:hypothetical protein
MVEMASLWVRSMARVPDFTASTFRALVRETCKGFCTQLGKEPTGWRKMSDRLWNAF